MNGPTTSTSSAANNNTSSVNHAMEAALASLQPLRDLSRNWDVDIASCLEEYLHELAQIAPEGVTITTTAAAASAAANPSANDDNDNDSSSTMPNFAHAALILQNSSNVYGRKVEYLHTLVYKALEEIFKSSSSSSHDNGGNGRRKSSKSTDAAIDEFYDFDPYDDFLLLDDVIPEDLSASKKKINLPSSMIGTVRYGREVETGGDSSMRRYSTGTTPVDRSLMTVQNRSRLSLGGMTATRLDGTVITSYGGPSSSSSPAQQRALMNILNSGDLRLVDRLCDVGKDGALLIPGSSHQSAPTSTDPASNQSFSEGNDATRSLFGDEYAGSTTNANSDSNDAVMDDVNPDYGGDDYDDDGPGYVMYDFGDDNGAGDEQDPSMNENVDVHKSKRVRFAADASDAPARKEKDDTTKSKPDPWALLDPHSAQDSKLAKKVLKKGRTYRLPDGIDKPPSECVTGSSTTSAVNQNSSPSWDQQPIRPSLIVESFRIAMGKQLDSQIPSLSSTRNPFRGLVFGDEFMYIAKDNARKRAARRRAERKGEKFASSDNGSVPTSSVDSAQTGLEDDDDDYGYDGGFDFGDGGDDFDDNDAAEGNAGFGSLDDAFRQPGETGNGESNPEQTFEELCQAHIRAFAKGAEKFALSTKLSERVSKWQSRLAPILEEEEQLAAFDIHHYSKVLIEKAVGVSAEVGNKRKSDGSTKLQEEDVVTTEFENVTKGCTKRDICRLFLASLSLANAGNLLIEEGSDENYRFEIISSEVRNIMEDYLAPSVRN